MNELVTKYQLDALVVPFNTVPPPLLVGGAGEGGGVGASHSLVSNSQLPGIIMPTGYTKQGLPIALQFTGKDFDDLNLLRVAAGYEAASHRRITPPTTPALNVEKFEYE
jgi:Asp-tRNA(Asn)/Glu-tRNA(Gln) amidotransferase A subunit family amidase